MPLTVALHCIPVTLALHCGRAGCGGRRSALSIIPQELPSLCLEIGSLTEAWGLTY